MTQSPAHQGTLNNQPALALLKAGAEETFGGLWASLFYSGRVSGKSILVCSATRREGATTVAAALALTGSAPTGSLRVALVDFNMRSPALDKLLNLKPAPGVSEIVGESMDPAIAAQRVTSGLDVYVAGRVSGHTLKILRSAAVREFFEVLQEGYDHVVVDAAAVNLFPDVQILAGTIRDVVLVSHTEQTPREAVAQAKKRLEAGGGKLAGLVMNMRAYPIPRFLYRRI